MDITEVVKFEDLEEKVKRYNPNADLSLLRLIFAYSINVRKDPGHTSMKPHLFHSLHAANLLADMRLDVAAIGTCLLLDAIEENPILLEQIQDTCGDEVAHLVKGVVKVSALEQQISDDDNPIVLRSMLLETIEDLRVLLIKIADCLANMWQIGYLPPARRRHVANLALEIYAPLANRLGMGKMRSDLEDLAFQEVLPEAFSLLKEQVEKRRAATQASLEHVKTQIADKLNLEDTPFISIEGRIKPLYSLYLKMQRLHLTLDQTYDLLAVRIITKEKIDCYRVLGVVHKYWRLVAGLFKDRIALPLPNGYQSLHTSVIGEEGFLFEIQIRTQEMHYIAEEGVAAHWRYKEGREVESRDEDERLKWFRRSAQWLQEGEDLREFAEFDKAVIATEKVFVFSAKGGVFELPRNSTPVDFAYAIHTQVGDQCIGAKVNGRIVPLQYHVQTGDTIEILTSLSHKPNRDWLNFVVTARARNKIKHYVTQRQREEAIEVGRKLFEKEAVRLKLKPKRILDDPQLEMYRLENGYSKLEDMYAAIGYGKLLAKSPLSKFISAEKFEELDKTAADAPQQSTKVVKRTLKLGDDRIAIKGMDNVLVYRAQCCNPIRGEEIIGYITRGKGVSVHARRCKNAANLMVNREHIIEVNWVGDGGGEPYAVTLVVRTEDHAGQLAALTNAVADAKTNIRDARTDNLETGDGIRLIEMTVDILDLQHLERVRSALKNVQGVVEVERVSPRF